MSKNRLTTIIASAAAAGVIIAVGAWSIGRSSNDSATASSAPAAQMGRALGGPPGGRPGFGTPVTGATAAQVKNAALAKYKGTVEGVMKLPDGSYVVHVFTSSGELHVAVSKGLQVIGSQQGGRPPGARPSVPGGPPPSSNGAGPGRSA
jgi:hypothetical protein